MDKKKKNTNKYKQKQKKKTSQYDHQNLQKHTYVKKCKDDESEPSTSSTYYSQHEWEPYRTRRSTEHHQSKKPDPNQWDKNEKKSRSRLKYSSRNQGHISTADVEKSQSDIPGFYYDKEKNRYFKILENSTISKVVTRETISREKAEKKRLKDLKSLGENKSLTEPFCEITNLLFKLRQGDICPTFYKNSLLKNHTKNLRLTDSFPFFDSPSYGHERIEHMTKMISSPDHDKLLCLWSMKETIMQRLQLVQLSEKNRTSDDKPLSITLEPGGTTVLQSWSKITNVCWAPFKKCPERRNILYTTNCHSTGQALAFIRNLDATTESELVFFDFSIGNQATWTCAWNSDTEKFSVGAEKTCLLIDVETRRLWELNTLNSDPLTQVFSSKNMLYNGTKKGQIVAHDLRTSTTRPVRCVSHKSSISHLLLSVDNNYLYASDYTGQLKVWDARKNSVVMQYNGLYNEYKRIPFYIDESNTILYGVGQDGYSRIWCLKSGQLLLNLPPPCPTSIDTIPALQFSTRWANRAGNSGLLMGLGEKLYLYSS